MLIPLTPPQPRGAPCKLHLQDPVTCLKERERERERKRKKQKQRAEYLHVLERLEACWPEPHESLLLGKRAEEHQSILCYGKPGLMDLEANFILITGILSDFTDST